MEEAMRLAMRNRDYFAFEDNFIKTQTVASRLVCGTPRACRFTVVIPTYKKPELLLHAVQSALHQKNFTDYQILVVDDEGSDELETENQRNLTALKDERILYYRNEKNLGLFANWNRCFTLAQGEWVVMLHDDDLLTETYLSWMDASIKAAPQARMIVGRMAEYQVEGKTPRQELCRAVEAHSATLRRLGTWRVQYGVAVGWQGACIRRDAWMETGGAHLGERIIRGEAIGGCYSEDYCAMVRFLHHYPAYQLTLNLYRVGMGANSSLNVWEWQDSLVLQYWCSLYLARRSGLFAPILTRAAAAKILQLARYYNSGVSYLGSAGAGIDLAQLRADCELPAEGEPGAGCAKLWKRLDKLHMWVSHIRDVRVRL